QARDKTDVMVMKNGDRMTCEVKGLERGVLYVKFEYIDGTASVNWSKVARLESNYLFYVKTEDGSVYTGTLSTPETGPGRPVLVSDLKWNFSFYGNWDNRPSPGFSGSDYGTSSGITWSLV